MQRVRQLLAAEANADPAEATRRAEMTTSELRREFDLGEPVYHMPGLTWNQENEATFLRTAHDQGWTPDLVQNLMSDYLRVAAGTMGTITDDMVTEFHQKYGDRPTQKERDALVQWIRRPA